MSESVETLLEVTDLSVRYGSTVALNGVTLSVGVGEIVAILGANGAGKSTLASTIAGLVPPVSGSIRFMGKSIDKLAAYQRGRRGIVSVPEGRGVFRDLTVMENLKLGVVSQKLGHKYGRESISLDSILARYPRLSERLKQAAGTLSGGEQQMLVLARAMLSDPKLLILDEPSLGLAPYLVEETFDEIKRYADLGISVLLIEQNVAMSLELAQRALVLSNGNVVASGTTRELSQNGALMDIYLGSVDSLQSHGD